MGRGARLRTHLSIRTCMIGPAFQAQDPSKSVSGGKSVAVQIRKLSSDEAAKVFPKRGQMDLSEYADALRELQPGDAAEIDLAGLSSRALKRRLGQAAKQTGYSLKWARDSGSGQLRFQVREARGTQTKARNCRRVDVRAARP